MKYSVVSLPPFEKQLKRLVGNGCFKIRLSIASKGRGKSGGARIITHLYFDKQTVFLLAIYDKNEQADISTRELKGLLSGIE